MSMPASSHREQPKARSALQSARCPSSTSAATSAGSKRRRTGSARWRHSVRSNSWIPSAGPWPTATRATPAWFGDIDQLQPTVSSATHAGAGDVGDVTGYRYVEGVHRKVQRPYIYDRQRIGYVDDAKAFESVCDIGQPISNGHSQCITGRDQRAYDGIWLGQCGLVQISY